MVEAGFNHTIRLVKDVVLGAAGGLLIPISSARAMREENNVNGIVGEITRTILSYGAGIVICQDIPRGLAFTGTAYMAAGISNRLYTRY